VKGAIALFAWKHLRKTTMYHGQYILSPCRYSN